MGISEAWVPEDVVPLKPRYLAELKSNNYMLNAMTAMEAQARGGTFGIAVDSAGLLRESCALNVVIVSATNPQIRGKWDAKTSCSKVFFPQARECLGKTHRNTGFL